MIFQRLAGVCLLIGMICFGLDRFAPPQPLIVTWLTLIFCALALILFVVAFFARRREGR